MHQTYRHVMVIAFVLAGCAVADTGPEDVEEIAMSTGGPRVLGKRAFDSAAAGFPDFEPLSTESRGKTLARAADRITQLDRELIMMQTHFDPRARDHALASRLAHVTGLIAEARLKIATAGPDEAIDAATVDRVVTLLSEAQRGLHVVRQERVKS